ncbi:transcription factor atf21 [Fusarium longipes]|uniref:Transcription factor atf21 n=1 Tax=Fusarium longipes TaxID=694270 RepID=A0A395SMJ8_9HYPO|nr:transcription factor atf21 [Fusarium longipes]
MDLPFGNPMNIMATTPSPGYNMTSSSYFTRTPSPTSQGTIGYQPFLGQTHGPSFFEEAIGGSPFPHEIPFALMQPPQYDSTPDVPHGFLPPPAIVPSNEVEQRPARHSRSRNLPQLSTDASDEVNGPAATLRSPKPKKRGRKPKAGPKDSGKGRQYMELDEDDLPKDPRRRRILERNRIAATKCRLRKRDEASALASQEQAMEDQNRYLSSCFDSLTAEIYHLKTQLLQHTDCNCVLIQKYISNEAKKTVDGLLTCPSTIQPDNDAMSPYRRGSCHSGTSPTESLSVPTPEFEGVSPGWPQAFHSGYGSSPDVAEEMFDMTADPYSKASIHMHNQPFPNIVHHHEHEVFAGMGTQPQQFDASNWNPSWGF